MRAGRILLFILFSLTLGACGESASTRAPTLFDGDWIAFSHPGNWDLAQQEQGEQRVIRLAAPSAVHFSITVRPSAGGADLAGFARGFARDAAAPQLTPVDRPARLGRLHGYRETLQLQGRTLVREYHSLSRNDETAYLVSEAPAADLARVQGGFDRIFTTFTFK